MHISTNVYRHYAACWIIIIKHADAPPPLASLAPQQVCVQREAGVWRRSPEGPHSAALLHLPRRPGEVVFPCCCCCCCCLCCLWSDSSSTLRLSGVWWIFAAGLRSLVWAPSSSPSRSLFTQDRHTAVKRGEGESPPPGTNPDDVGHTFRFSTGDGQALQVRPAYGVRHPGVWHPGVRSSASRRLASGLCCSPFDVLKLCSPSPGQPSSGHSPAPGAGQPQEWRQAGGAVSSHHSLPPSGQEVIGQRSWFTCQIEWELLFLYFWEFSVVIAGF